MVHPAPGTPPLVLNPTPVPTAAHPGALEAHAHGPNLTLDSDPFLILDSTPNSEHSIHNGTPVHTKSSLQVWNPRPPRLGRAPALTSELPLYTYNQTPGTSRIHLSPQLSARTPSQSWGFIPKTLNLYSVASFVAQIPTQTSGLDFSPHLGPDPRVQTLSLSSAGPPPTLPAFPPFFPYRRSLVFSSSSHPLLLFLSGCAGPTLFSGFSSGFSESCWVSSLSVFVFLSCLVSFAHVPNSLGLSITPPLTTTTVSLGLYLCSSVSPCGHPFSLYLPLIWGEAGTGSESQYP